MEIITRELRASLHLELLYADDLSQKDVQLGINGEGELKGQMDNPGSPEKMAVKMVCVNNSLLT